MPKSKLETLQAEQDYLKKKKNPTASDTRRLTTLGKLIREERAKVSATYGGVFTAGAGAENRWRKGIEQQATRFADVTDAKRRTTRDVARTQFGFDPLADFMVGDDVVDPVTGKSTGGTENWRVTPDLAGYRFGPTSAGDNINAREFGMGPKGAGTTVRNGRDISMMTGMSVKDIQDFYYSLNDVELTKFQTELVQAGLIDDEGGGPTLGFRDVKTGEGLNTLLRIWMDNPDTPITQLLKKLKQNNAGKLDEKTRKMLGIGAEDGIPDQTANVTITDAETLGSLIDKLSVNLIGGLADPSTKQALIQQIQDEERAFKLGAVRAEFDTGVTNERNARKVKAEASGGSELDAFMDALIGQESGGNPNAVNADSGAMGIGQIMPENWGPWSAEAGVDPRDFSEANQRKVIKYKLAQYYQSYGNWRDVAIAWYGGHGGVMRAKAGGGFADEDGYPSLHAYADSVLAKMGQGTASNLAGGRQPSEPQLTVNVRSEMADPATRIESELRRLNPGRYAGTRFSKQAEAFFGLLHGSGSQGYR